jgi:heme/copper-type cytochrome/quinol oxidase subunit 2
MMVVTGFKMMSALDKEDKIKEGRKWLVNIIIALVLIKIVDYVFYIAQSVSFAAKASALILDVAKVLWWVLGIVFVLWLIFAGYSMFMSNGDEKAMKKTKSILMNIFMISLVLFFFLLIIYEIFKEFVK